MAARFFRQLDRAYPGARFILTVRDLEGWLASCERFFCEGRLRGDHVLNKLRLDLYGATCFERTRFADAYARHVDGVQAYFGDRPDDLLVLDVVGGDGWGPLCRFLSHDRPDAPFPRARSRERVPDLTLSGALARHARADPLRHAARTVARLLGA